MAKHGLWSEALFRFREAERLDPQNPRIQNNLGVAYEAAGDYDKALDYYKKALKMDPNSKDLRANYARFVEFYQGFKSSDKAAQGAPAAVPARPSPPGPMDATPPPSGSPVGTPEPATPGPPPPAEP
jgi:tetratricopeptide (TPR) repeat protein